MMTVVIRPLSTAWTRVSRSAAARSPAAARTRKAGRPARSSAGVAAATRDRMASTTRSSSRVKPLGRSPAGGIGILPVAGFDAVGAEAPDVEGAVRAGKPVEIGVAPGVLQIVELGVRAVPAGRVGRRRDQRQQPFA